VASNVQIVITAQDSASQAFKSVAQSAGGMGNALTSAIGVAAGGAALAGISALSGAVSGLGDSMIGANARLETATATFEAFTKDAGKAQNIVAALRKEAAITPFEQADMISAGKSLISVVKGDEKALMGLIKEAEILAALNPAEGLEGAAFALKEATSGDFASVIERFNLSRSSINKFKAEGKEGIDVVRAALKEMGADSSLVEKLANTFEGRQSSVNDFFDEFKRVLGAGIFEKMSEGMAKTLETLNESGPGLLEFAATVGSALGDAAGHVFAFTSKVTGALMQVFQGFQSGGVMGAAANIAMLLGFDEDTVSRVIETIEPIVARIQEVIGQIVGGFQTGGLAGGGVNILTHLFGMDEDAAGELIDGVLGTIGRVIGDIQALFSGGMVGAIGGMSLLHRILGVDMDQAAEIMGTWSDLFATVQELAAGLGTNLATAVQSFIPALETLGGFAQNTLIPALQEIGAVIIGQILPTLIELGATIYANVIPTLVEVAGTIASTVIPILTGLAGFVLDNVVPAIRELGAAFQAWTQEILPLIEPAMQGVLTVIQTVMGAISAFWEEHWDTIATVLQAVWDVIKGQIEGSLTLIGGIIKAALQVLGGDWEGAWQTMQTTVNTAFDQMMGGINKAMSSIGGLIRDGLAGIAAWAGGVAAQIGDAIVSGLSNAITAGARAVATSAANLVTGALNAAKAAAGIQSPSKATYEIGEELVNGLLNAIDQGAPEVVEAWQKYIKFILDTGDSLNDWLTHLPSAWQDAGKAVGNFIAAVREGGDVLNDWLTEIPDQLKPEAFAAGLALAEELGHGLSDPHGVIAGMAKSLGVTMSESVQNGWAESMAKFNPQSSFDFLDQRDFEHWQEQKKGLPELLGGPGNKVNADMWAALNANALRAGGSSSPTMWSPVMAARPGADNDLLTLLREIRDGLREQKVTISEGTLTGWLGTRQRMAEMGA
jgi:hypothetical protein